MDTSGHLRFGSSLTRTDLDADLYHIVEWLRVEEPLAWIPALNGWLITRRDLAIEILEDADRFTVDDPRFAVRQVMGPNMLGLDGGEHARHRAPFEPEFKMSAVRRGLVESVEHTAHALVTNLADNGEMEVRRDLAAPLAVEVMRDVLGIDVDSEELLRWYDDIVMAMTAASDGVVDRHARPPVMDHIGEAVRSSALGRSDLLSTVARDLDLDDVIANVAVVLFGGIETSETMTASAFAHILGHTDTDTDIICGSPNLLAKAIDESLRLEPAVAQIDRFVTEDVVVNGVQVRAGDFVMISVAAANRDPAFYANPNVFDPYRSNARNHLAFARGPHTCLGMHLARVETRAAIDAAFIQLPGIRLDGEVVWKGSVFRKPLTVRVSWNPINRVEPHPERLT